MEQKKDGMALIEIKRCWYSMQLQDALIPSRDCIKHCTTTMQLLQEFSIVAKTATKIQVQ